MLDRNKSLANEYNAGKSKSGDLYYAGSFDPVAVEAWERRHGCSIRDRDALIKMLNDPEMAAFRIWKGRV